MIYLPEHRFIFISVPRTGSVSFQESLCSSLGVKKNKIFSGKGDQIVSDHISASELKALIGADEWDKCWKVALARNPWDRVLSTYYYNRDGVVNRGIQVGNKIPLKLWLKYMSAKVLPFAAWVYVYPYHDCCEYICDESGHIIVDTVYAFSSIDMAFAEVLEYLGKHEKPLKKTNVSKGKPAYRSVYSNKSQRYVANRYHRDIWHFKWDFNSDDDRNILLDNR